ncbi:hypothetical protein ACOMHN_004353 [Nucella lapillus]
MKCLARWPEKVEGDLPSYPGFERDVFGVVRDYFLGLEEPLIAHDLYDIIINVFVQACHHLPRHSSPFSRDEKRFCYSLFSNSSLENVIMNLTRKYCLTDSKGDIHSLTDSRADIHSLAHSRPDLSGGALTQGGSQALSHCDWFSGAHSLAQSRTSLARSQTNLGQSQTNLGQSQTNLGQSWTGLAQSRTGLAQSQTGLVQNVSSSGRPLKGCQRDVRGVGQGERDPQPAATSSQCSTLPRRQARSRSHLPGHSLTPSQCSTLPRRQARSRPHLPGHSLSPTASSQGDLRGVGASPGDLVCGVSASSLCVSGGWQHAAAPTRTASQATLGHCFDPSSLRDSRQFRSNPDLQVSRYETAFGPDDQTVTRVYYCNGMATDFHHSAAEEDHPLSPVETHFDVVTDSAAAKRQSSRVSCERVNGSSSFATDKSVNLTRGSESLRNSAGRSRSYNSFQRQQQQRSSSYDSSAFASSSEHQDSGLDDRKLSSPLWDTQGKPPPYRRSRGERYKTFSGAQLGVDQPREGEGGGLEEEDRRLSVSTPYLPGLRLGGGVGDPGEGGAPPLRPSSRSQGLSSGSAARCSSLYLNVPQSVMYFGVSLSVPQSVMYFGVSLTVPHASVMYFGVSLSVVYFGVSLSVPQSVVYFGVSLSVPHSVVYFGVSLSVPHVPVSGVSLSVPQSVVYFGVSLSVPQSVVYFGVSLSVPHDSVVYFGVSVSVPQSVIYFGVSLTVPQSVVYFGVSLTVPQSVVYFGVSLTVPQSVVYFGVSLTVPQSGLQEERTVKALQLVCLFLPPASRRKLHFLLKLMSKMAANPFLTFDPSQTTRSLKIKCWARSSRRCCAGRGRGEGELDAVLVFQLVSFLVDHHMDVMAVPTDLKHAVEGRLTALEKPQIVYSPRDPGTLRFARPVSTEQYEASKRSHSHNALVALLDAMVRDGSVVPRERRRRLKQFQKTYPQIYRQRFPDATSDPLNCDPSLQGRPPLLSRPLNKLRGLRV